MRNREVFVQLPDFVIYSKAPVFSAARQENQARNVAPARNRVPGRNRVEFEVSDVGRAERGGV